MHPDVVMPRAYIRLVFTTTPGDAIRITIRYPSIGLNVKPNVNTRQKLTLIASIPLSDEAWILVAENQLLVLEKGRILKQE